MEKVKIKWVTEKEVSLLTSRALQTLRNDRFLGQGIPYVKLNRSVRYKLKDIYDYMEKHRIVTND